MTKQEILLYLSNHKDEFFQRFGLIKLGLFGSYAKGTNSEESDIDIIIELDNNLDNVYSKKKEFKLVLENYFQKNVDIAREKYLKPLAKESIMEHVTYV